MAPFSSLSDILQLFFSLQRFGWNAGLGTQSDILLYHIISRWSSLELCECSMPPGSIQTGETEIFWMYIDVSASIWLSQLMWRGYHQDYVVQSTLLQHVIRGPCKKTYKVTYIRLLIPQFFHVNNSHPFVSFTTILISRYVSLQGSSHMSWKIITFLSKGQWTYGPTLCLSLDTHIQPKSRRKNMLIYLALTSKSHFRCRSP